jgi:serine/threonine-protein phosphatase 2B catalytic subunit
MLKPSITESEAPATFVPTDEQFWSKKDSSKPDLDFIKNHFLREGRLSNEQALAILKKGTAILKTEETLLDLESPLTGKK